MSEEIKPVYIEEKTKRLQEIIEQTEQAFNHEVRITPGEAKRIELIRKMKQDTDRQEYMIMFNALTLVCCLVSLAHFLLHFSLWSLICLLLCLVYFLFTRKRLTSATLQLVSHKHHFDKYLWEGFFLKEMRYSAVKLAYLIFFPFIMVFISELLLGAANKNTLWLSVPLAFALSSIGWLIFFSDDKSMLESIESDLKSLEYL